MDTTDDGSVDIRIELPLPIDITGTLINIIGLTYPGAMIEKAEAKIVELEAKIADLKERLAEKDSELG